MFKTGERLLEEALAALGFSTFDSGKGTPVAVNTLAWPRSELVKMPASAASADKPQYALVKGSTGVSSIESLSQSPQSCATVKEIKKGVFQLANNQFKLNVEGGSITSLVDLTINRELIPEGSKANQLVIYDDRPLYWQAWDVEVFHLESREELPAGNTEIVEDGPHRVGVVTETKISEKSWIKTTIYLNASVEPGTSYIEMQSEVEWRENMKFLKVEFPVDITNTEASYETQYGIVRRPTHYNTR